MSADRQRGEALHATTRSRNLFKLDDGQVPVARMEGDDEFESGAWLAPDRHVWVGAAGPMWPANSGDTILNRNRRFRGHHTN